jgi:DNA mismatch repair protein MSH6
MASWSLASHASLRVFYASGQTTLNIKHKFSCTTPIVIMARGIEGNEISTPKPTLKKSGSSSQSTKGQKSILGFFSKQAPTPKSAFSQRIKTESAINSSPAPSSDAVAPSSPELGFHSSGKNKENGLLSPSSSLEPVVTAADGVVEGVNGVPMSSPSRKVSLHSLQRASVTC